MASSPHTSMPSLPEAPRPRLDARERHIGQAVRRFATQHGASGASHGAPRVLHRRATLLRRPATAALAASLLVAVAAPIAWQVTRELEGEKPAASGTAPAETLRADVRGEAAAGAGGSQDGAAIVAVAPAPQVAEAAVPARTPIAEIARGEQALKGSLPAGGAAGSVAGSNPPAPPPSPSAPNSPQAFRSSGGTRFGSADTSAASPLAAPARPALTARSLASDAVRPGYRPRHAGDQAMVAQQEARAPAEPVGRDTFAGQNPQAFQSVQAAPVSTFSIDVDTASYSFVRASLNRNVLPQPGAVRVEEMINYFPYDDPRPESLDQPFRTSVAVYPSPWAEGRKIVRIAVKGYAAQAATRPAANLVFLVDTSGSMDAPNRLPLVKQALAMLVGQLDARDRVSIVTYAGRAGTVLEPTSAAETGKILAAIEGLDAGGSTAGAEGIRQAYRLAERSYQAGGVNRVMLATDGDFNVGITSRDELKGFIERERGKGIYLSVLGFGMGNYNDAMMQALAQNGNGVAAYIDTLGEARKVMVEEASSALVPIANDVKIQVEFNPAAVSEYRLIGYETRMLNREDFANDKVDAGDVGSGGGVTALYEIVPVGGPSPQGDLRYRPAATVATDPAPAEYAFVKVRYKKPGQTTSELVSTPVDRSHESQSFEGAPEEARFSSAVAAFSELLRGGRYQGRFGFDDVARIAAASRGPDPYGYRSEFLGLVSAAKTAAAMAPLPR